MGASKPRRQQLTITTKALAEPAYAVVRVSWYQQGRASTIDELQLESGIDNIEAVLEEIIKNALKAGADVSVITTASADQFRLDT